MNVGWAAGPAEIVTQLLSAKQTTDQCAGALGQRIFEEYVRRGWIDEQLEASRELYRRKCDRTLAALRQAAEGSENTMPFILDAVRAYATVGEMCTALKDVFGAYTETSVL